MFWLLFILLFNCILLLFWIVVILIPFFIGLPKRPDVSSSSSSSPNISLLKKLERLNFPPPIGGFFFSFIITLVLFIWLLLIIFGNWIWGFICVFAFLSIPPSPSFTLLLTCIDSIAGFINSFPPSFFSLSGSNIFSLFIGLPICCWIILWNSSGLLFTLLIFWLILLTSLLLTLLLLMLLLILILLLTLSFKSLMISSPCAPLSLGTITPCSFLSSLSKFSSSSSSSSITRPI